MLDDEQVDDTGKSVEEAKGKTKEVKAKPVQQVSAEKTHAKPADKAVDKGKQRARDSRRRDPTPSSSSESDSDSDSESDSHSDTDVAVNTDNDVVMNDGLESEAPASEDADLVPPGSSTAVKEAVIALKAHLDKVEANTEEDKRAEAVYTAFTKFSKRMGKKAVDFTTHRDQNVAMNRYYFIRTGITDNIPAELKPRNAKKGPQPRPRPRPRSKPSQASKQPGSRTQTQVSQAPSPSQPLRRGRSASRHTSGATQPPDTESSSDDEDTDSLEEPSRTTDDAPQGTTSTPPAQWMEKPLQFFSEGPAGSSPHTKALVSAWVDFERSKGFPEVRSLCGPRGSFLADVAPPVDYKDKIVKVTASHRTPRMDRSSSPLRASAKVGVEDAVDGFRRINGPVVAELAAQLARRGRMLADEEGNGIGRRLLGRGGLPWCKRTLLGRAWGGLVVQRVEGEAAEGVGRLTGRRGMGDAADNESREWKGLEPGETVESSHGLER